MHTRVVVRVRREGDMFWRETLDRGAKFRDETDIAMVTEEIKAEMHRRYTDPIFQVDTREAG